MELATATLIDGNHSFSARAIDTFSNASQKSACALSVDVDTLAPGAPTLITTVTPENGVTNDDVMQLAGTAEANTIVYVYDDAALIGASTVDASEMELHHTKPGRRSSRLRRQGSGYCRQYRRCVAAADNHG